MFISTTSKASFRVLRFVKLLAEEGAVRLHHLLTMLSPKRLVEKAKRGIPLMRSNSRASSCSADSTTVVAIKGHFIVYTIDDVRFMVPLAFLKSPIFQELLKISEEEFGLPGSGPITLACNATFMDYILTLLRRQMSGDVERALIDSIDANRCSSLSLLAGPGCQQQRIIA